jgi:O-antigen/teichoic acid export membrane protein
LSGSKAKGAVREALNIASVEVENGTAPEAVPVVAKIRRPSWSVVQTVVGGGIIMVLNASTGILTARALLPAGRGNLAAITLWPIFLAFVTSLGMPRALIYFLRCRKEESARLIPTGLMASMLLGCIAAVGGALFLPFWLHNYSHEVIRAAQFCLMTTPAFALIEAARAVLEASGSFLASNIVRVSQPAGTLAMLLCLLAVHHLTPVTAGFVYTFATVPSLLIVLWQVRDIVNSRWRMDIASCRLLLSYGIRSYGVDILGALALQLDQVLVIRMLAPAAMGIYGVTLSLSRMVCLFQVSVASVLFPQASGRTVDEILSMTEYSTRVSTLITGACAVAAGLVGPFLLRILYGREYAGASVTLDILLVEITLSGAVYVLSQAYMAVGRPGLVTIMQAIGLSLSIPMMLLLIPRWGINGAAAALIASTVARFLFVYFGFSFILRIPRPDLMPHLSDVQMILLRLKRLPAPKVATS